MDDIGVLYKKLEGNSITNLTDSCDELVPTDDSVDNPTNSASGDNLIQTIIGKELTEEEDLSWILDGFEDEAEESVEDCSVTTFHARKEDGGAPVNGVEHQNNLSAAETNGLKGSGKNGHSSQKSLKCNECNFTTDRVMHLKKHNLTHSKGVLHCKTCSYTTKRRNFLLKHESRCKKEKLRKTSTDQEEVALSLPSSEDGKTSEATTRRSANSRKQLGEVNKLQMKAIVALNRSDVSLHRDTREGESLSKIERNLTHRKDDSFSPSEKNASSDSETCVEIRSTLKNVNLGSEVTPTNSCKNNEELIRNPQQKPKTSDCDKVNLKPPATEVGEKEITSTPTESPGMENESNLNKSSKVGSDNKDTKECQNEKTQNKTELENGCKELVNEKSHKNITLTENDCEIIDLTVEECEEVGPSQSKKCEEDTPQNQIEENSRSEPQITKTGNLLNGNISENESEIESRANQNKPKEINGNASESEVNRLNDNASKPETEDLKSISNECELNNLDGNASKHDRQQMNGDVSGDVPDQLDGNANKHQPKESNSFTEDSELKELNDYAKDHEPKRLNGISEDHEPTELNDSVSGREQETKSLNGTATEPETRTTTKHDTKTLNGSATEHEIEALNASATKHETEALNASATKHETEALNASATKHETKSINGTATEPETRALNDTATKHDTKTLNGTATDHETEALNVSATKHETEALNASATKHETKAINGTAAEPETRALNDTATKHDTKTLNGTATEHKTEALNASAIKHETRAINGTTPEHETKALNDTTKHDTKTLNGTATEHETEALNTSATKHETKAINGNVTEPETKALNGTATEHETEALNGTATKHETKAINGTATEPETKALNGPATEHKENQPNNDSNENKSEQLNGDASVYKSKELNTNENEPPKPCENPNTEIDLPESDSSKSKDEMQGESIAEPLHIQDEKMQRESIAEPLHIQSDENKNKNEFLSSENKSAKVDLNECEKSSSSEECDVIYQSTDSQISSKEDTICEGGIKCNLCDDEFSAKESLWKHVLDSHSVTQEKSDCDSSSKWNCLFCTYWSNDKCNVKRHAQNKHQDICLLSQLLQANSSRPNERSDTNTESTPNIDPKNQNEEHNSNSCCEVSQQAYEGISNSNVTDTTHTNRIFEQNHSRTSQLNKQELSQCSSQNSTQHTTQNTDSDESLTDPKNNVESPVRHSDSNLHQNGEEKVPNVQNGEENIQNVQNGEEMVPNVQNGEINIQNVHNGEENYSKISKDNLNENQNADFNENVQTVQSIEKLSCVVEPTNETDSDVQILDNSEGNDMGGTPEEPQEVNSSTKTEGDKHLQSSETKKRDSTTSTNDFVTVRTDLSSTPSLSVLKQTENHEDSERLTPDAYSSEDIVSLDEDAEDPQASNSSTETFTREIKQEPLTSHEVRHSVRLSIKKDDKQRKRTSCPINPTWIKTSPTSEHMESKETHSVPRKAPTQVFTCSDSDESTPKHLKTNDETPYTTPVDANYSRYGRRKTKTFKYANFCHSKEAKAKITLSEDDSNDFMGFKEEPKFDYQSRISPTQSYQSSQQQNPQNDDLSPLDLELSVIRQKCDTFLNNILAATVQKFYNTPREESKPTIISNQHPISPVQISPDITISSPDLNMKPDLTTDFDVTPARTDTTPCNTKGKKLFQCSLCDFETNYKQNVERHNLQKHSTPREQAKSMTPVTKEDKKSTIVNAKSDKAFQCLSCDYASKDKSNFNRHLRLWRHRYEGKQPNLSREKDLCKKDKQSDNSKEIRQEDNRLKGLKEDHITPVRVSQRISNSKKRKSDDPEVIPPKTNRNCEVIDIEKNEGLKPKSPCNVSDKQPIDSVNPAEITQSDDLVILDTNSTSVEEIHSNPQKRLKIDDDKDEDTQQIPVKEVKYFNCPHCPLKTKRKYNLDRHVHKNHKGPTISETKEHESKPTKSFPSGTAGTESSILKQNEDLDSVEVIDIVSAVEERSSKSPPSVLSTLGAESCSNYHTVDEVERAEELVVNNLGEKELEGSVTNTTEEVVELSTQNGDLSEKPVTKNTDEQSSVPVTKKTDEEVLVLAGNLVPGTLLENNVTNNENLCQSELSSVNRIDGRQSPPNSDQPTEPLFVEENQELISDKTILLASLESAKTRLAIDDVEVQSTPHGWSSNASDSVSLDSLRLNDDELSGENSNEPLPQANCVDGADDITKASDSSKEACSNVPLDVNEVSTLEIEEGKSVLCNISSTPDVSDITEVNNIDPLKPAENIQTLKLAIPSNRSLSQTKEGMQNLTSKSDDCDNFSKPNLSHMLQVRSRTKPTIKTETPNFLDVKVSRELNFCPFCNHKCYSKHHMSRHIERCHRNQLPQSAEKYSLRTKDRRSVPLKYSDSPPMVVMPSSSISNDIHCLHCSYQTYKQSNLKKHVFRMHKHRPKSENRLANRETTIRPSYKKSMKCTQCCFTTHFTNIMKKHFAVTHNRKLRAEEKRGRRPKGVLPSFKGTEGAVKCTDCDYKTSLKAGMVRHIQKWHQHKLNEKRVKKILESFKESILCPCCDYKATWKSNMRKHMNDKHEQKNFKFEMKRGNVEVKPEPSSCQSIKCLYCNFYTSRKSMKKHVSLTHKPKPELENMPERMSKRRNVSLMHKLRSELENMPERMSKRRDVSLTHNPKPELENMPERMSKRRDFSLTHKPKPELENMPERMSKRRDVSLTHNPKPELKNMPERRSERRDVSLTHNPKPDLENMPERIGERRAKDALQCSQCDFTTNWKSSFLRHVESIHGQELSNESPEIRCKKTPLPLSDPLHCPYCNYKSPWKSCMTKHIGVMHKCKLEEEERAKKKLEIRAERELVETPISLSGEKQCTDCSYRCFRRDRLVRHALNYHGRHLTPLNSEKTTVNELGNPKQEAQPELKYPTSIPALNGLKKCSFCKYETFRNSNLKNHLKRHHKSNSSTSVLKEIQHEMITRKRQIKPTKKAGFTYSDFPSLRTVSNVAQEPERCPHCNYNTWRKAVFRKHLLKMHEKQLSKTKLRELRRGVNMPSTRPPKLLKSSNVSNGCLETPVVINQMGKGKIQCPYCDFKSFKGFDLRKHVRLVHRKYISKSKFSEICVRKKEYGPRNLSLTDAVKPVMDRISSEIEWVHCPYCSYKTLITQDYNLRRHMNGHKSNIASLSQSSSNQVNKSDLPLCRSKSRGTPKHLSNESVKHKVTKPEIVNPKVTKPENIKSKVTKPENVYPKVTKPEIVNPKVTKPENVKTKVTKPENVYPNLTKPENVKAKITKPENDKAKQTSEDLNDSTDNEEIRSESGTVLNVVYCCVSCKLRTPWKSTMKRHIIKKDHGAFIRLLDPSKRKSIA